MYPRTSKMSVSSSSSRSRKRKASYLAPVEGRPRQRRADGTSETQRAGQASLQPMPLPLEEIQHLVAQAGYEKLGEGSFGPVYSATMQSGEEAAVKQLSDQQLAIAKENPMRRQFVLKAFRTEISVLSRIRHDNIVRLIAYSEEDHPSEQLALVYERVEMDLYSALFNDKSRRKTLRATERLAIAIDIARGITFLHGQSSDTNSSIPERMPNGEAACPIWHRDIKTENIGITKDHPPRGKLLDCGIAKTRSETDRTMMTGTGGTAMGTLGYMAPEAVGGKYCTQSEVFSFGIVLLELLTSRSAKAGEETLKDYVDDAVEEGHTWVDGECGWPTNGDKEIRRTMDSLCNLAL
eukprot:g2302.t1